MKTVLICRVCGTSLEYCKYCDEYTCPYCDGKHKESEHIHNGYSYFHETD